MAYINPLVDDPREDKLPAWVRDKLTDLRRQLRAQKRRADEARLAGGPEDTDVVLDQYDDVPVRLPKRSRVTFLVDPDQDARITVHVEPATRFSGARLSLNGTRGLRIYPYAGNAVRVDLEPR